MRKHDDEVDVLLLDDFQNIGSGLALSDYFFYDHPHCPLCVDRGVDIFLAFLEQYPEVPFEGRQVPSLKPKGIMRRPSSWAAMIRRSIFSFLTASDITSTGSTSLINSVIFRP